MFTDWIVEACILFDIIFAIIKIPHYTTLQKFMDRINIIMLGKIILSFILFIGTRTIFTGIDAIGFKITHASEYYSSRA
jgi:predicted tellurium resistance membrane protein TerC